MLDIYHNPKDVYQVNVDYVLEAGYFTTAGSNVLEYRLPEGFDVRGVVPNHTYALTDNSGYVMGTYQLLFDETTKCTYFRFVFNEDTVKRNVEEKQQVEGWLSIMISLDDARKSAGGTVKLPGGGVILINGKALATVPSVTHTNADNGQTNVDWQDSNGVTLNGNPWNEFGTKLEAWLPQLNPGESYTITYQAYEQLANGTSGAMTNTATATSSSDDVGKTVADDAQTYTWIGNQPNHYKTAGELINGAISWTVTLNSEHANLRGWTWTDETGEWLTEPETMKVCSSDGTCKDQAFGSLSFPTDDYRTYTITYSTPVDATWQSKYTNTSKLCQGEACITDASATYTRTHAFNKSAELVSDRKDSDGKRTAVARWTITLGGTDGFPAETSAANWTFADTLTQPTWDGAANHYLTSAQFAQLTAKVAEALAAIPDAGVTAQVTSSMDADDRIVGFTITGIGRIPAGSTVTIVYESTSDFSSDDPADLYNCVTDHVQDERCVRTWVPTYDQANQTPDPEDTPTAGTLSVGKRDTGRYAQQGVSESGQSSAGAYTATSHHYNGLAKATKTDGTEVPYLEWSIDIVPDFSQVGDTPEATEALVVTEHLPQGTRLLEGDVATTYNANATQGDLAGLSVRVSDKAWMRDPTNAFLFNDSGEAAVTCRDTEVWNNTDLLKYATAQLDESDPYKVKITFAPWFLSWYKSKVGELSWRDQLLTLVVRVTPTDLESITSGHVYANSVTVTHGERTAEASQSQTVSRDAVATGGKEVLNKVSQYDASAGLVATRNAITYQLNVNPQAVAVGQDYVGDDGRVEFSDTMTYRHEIGYDDSEFILDPDSVHVYRQATCLLRDPSGSCAKWEEGAQAVSRVKYASSDDGSTYGATLKYCKDGEGCRDQKPWDWRDNGWDAVPVMETAMLVELSSDDYSYTVTSKRPTNFIEDYLLEVPPKYTYEWSNTITFRVPDQQALIIEYQYKGFGNAQAWVGASNSFTFNGSEAFHPSDESFAVSIAAATAGAQISGAHITVHKIDADDSSVLLAGAKFRLEGYMCEETSPETGEDADAGTNDAADDFGTSTDDSDGAATESVSQCWQQIQLPYTEDANGSVAINAEGNLITDAKGTITLAGTYLRYNRAYRLIELEAPDGYQPPADGKNVTTFYIGKFKPNTNMLPDDEYPWQCPFSEEEGKEDELVCGDQKANGSMLWITNKRQVVILPSAGANVSATQVVLLGVMAIGGACVLAVVAARRRPI
ncbi:MAG: hypothetical protein UHD09_00525 [Bifidobacterium sp.]|nr:hypothetical protein [Bifidobacterium sp.]